MAHRLMRERLIPFAVATCVLMAETACDWPWRHDMADQPSRPAAAGPRLPATVGSGSGWHWSSHAFGRSHDSGR